MVFATLRTEIHRTKSQTRSVTVRTPATWNSINPVPPNHAQIGDSPVPNIPASVILLVHLRTKLLVQLQLCFCFTSTMMALPATGSAIALGFDA